LIPRDTLRGIAYSEEHIPNYTSRVEKDFWGNDRVVTRETVSGEDIVDFGSDVIRGFKQRRADAKADLAARQLDWAMQASDHGNYQGAIAVINEVIRNYPNDTAPYAVRAGINLDHAVITHEMGLIDEKNKMVAAAIADLNQVIRIGGDDSEAYWMRGSAYIIGEAYDYAMADANMCVKMTPNEAMGHLLKYRVFIEIEDYEQALMSAQRALHLEANSPAYIARGQAYYYMGDYERAVADFTRAIALDRNNKIAYTSRAKAYQKLGREEEANADFRAAERVMSPEVCRKRRH
jgi:tetratricopeptide (TPR) repeat protein